LEFRRVLFRSTDQISAAFASIGLLFASTSFVLWYFGTDPRYVEFITGTWLLGDISFSRQGVFNVAVAFVVVGAVLWGMHRTPAGEVLRATAISPRNAQLIGVPVRRVQLSMFALSEIGRAHV